VRHWTLEVPLLSAEIPRLRDQVEPLFKLTYNDNPERGPILCFLLDSAKRARDHTLEVRGPLGAASEGLIPLWQEFLADEPVHIEPQAVFEAYSLSWSRHLVTPAFGLLLACSVR
jgi:hypothetical protein